MSLEGSRRSDDDFGSNNLSAILHPESLRGLAKLQYLSLERVEILDSAAGETANKAQDLTYNLAEEKRF